MPKARQAVLSRVHSMLSAIFEEDIHARRILSLENATLGAMHAASLSVHAIGLGLAAAKDLNSKHTIKQVDRLLSNPGVSPEDLARSWVRFVVGPRTDIVAVIDWTDFDKDDQSTIALHMLTSHGRATPLLWKTVVKSQLEGWRNEHEDAILSQLRDVAPPGLSVTILGDRGFGDQKLYALMAQLRFDYVIRFRENILVENKQGEARPAADWVLKSGRATLIGAAKVTKDRYEVPAVVCVKAKGMADAWCLASSLSDARAAVIVSLYGRRFTIEESFRDLKDLRFGFGLSATRISRPDRRDRLLLVGALAVAVLTLLGAAGEAIGMDRMLKANTVKTRTHSLLRQGWHYYSFIPNMREERLCPLAAKFEELVREHKIFSEVFGFV